MSCYDCGEDVSHLNQIDEYPDGTRLVIIRPLPTEIDKKLPVGTFGKVIYHCDDGRICATFENDTQGSHTFHQPEFYLARCFDE